MIRGIIKKLFPGYRRASLAEVLEWVRENGTNPIRSYSSMEEHWDIMEISENVRVHLRKQADIGATFAKVQNP